MLVSGTTRFPSTSSGIFAVGHNAANSSAVCERSSTRASNGVPRS